MATTSVITGASWQIPLSGKMYGYFILKTAFEPPRTPRKSKCGK
jgi:hypothetical protein